MNMDLKLYLLREFAKKEIEEAIEMISCSEKEQHEIIKKLTDFLNKIKDFE